MLLSLKPLTLASSPEWEPTLGAGPLLGIAVAAVALILIAIIGFRLHAFITLILVSLLTAIATGIPFDTLVKEMTTGFGATLGSVALLVGLGAMLGKLVEASGGAKVLADAMINRFGENRAPLALGVASLIMGFPIFFDAGLVVMLPIVFAVAHRLRGSVIAYGIPAAAAFSVMHVFLPPHPGPVGASALLGANMGLVMLLGIIVAVPTFYVTGIIWGKYISAKVAVEMPNFFGSIPDEKLAKNPPSVGTVIGLMVLPVILIFFNTGLTMAIKAGSLDSESAFIQFLIMLGNTPIALLISVLVALIVLGKKVAEDKVALEKTIDSALGPICSIVLITGAGGMFGGILRASGIGDAMSGLMSDLGIPLVIAAYLIALALRLAQGSATVALLTAAGLVAPGVEAAVATGDLSALGVACIVLAASAGSVFASHVNDSGFWLVGRLMGMDVKTTLKVWTTQQAFESILAFLLVYVIYLFA
ncbi:GntP family permease [Corynebacterium caspium]|uniref:GntP family permease n=1 Tax=Corynebacterium caspium TaxID=234828 RepID=UPI00037BD3C0|nr:gluconate:H+ symporter [Corynebacterium caspium]WKD59749.1 Inner membrane permease YgbN [Corynebacterium caspium DSM 44850]